MEAKKKFRIWNIFDDLAGDKVVWMIVLLLMMYSVVSLFSASSCDPKVINGSISRVQAMKGEMAIILLGLGVVIGCYNIKNLKVFKYLGMAGFILSFAMLVFVDAHMSIGPIKAAPINTAWRVISIKGFQIHIYELIKVLMVLYLAWAIEAYQKKELPFVKALSQKKRFKFLKKDFAQKAIFIYIPIVIVALLIALQGFSTAAIMAIIMFLVILIGGLKMKEIIGPGFILLGILCGLFALYKIYDFDALKRFATVESRLEPMSKKEQRFFDAPKGTTAYYNALDDIRQQESAKVAVMEGGILGKGPGQSTQKYQVSMMFEDFMFSLLVEEYGIIFGGIVIMMLYLSLLARGSIIVRNCNDHFAKVTVAGLVLLITIQAFMHITINLGVGPMTGQTLPLISHGKSSFLVFCTAFGIILSISRMATKRIEREMKYKNAEDPIIERPENDSIQSELNTLDMLDSDEPMV